MNWREPERNAHVLDWRERAHEFGLVPIEEDRALEQVVEPPEQLLREDDPEAFDGRTEAGRLLLDDLRARGITSVSVAGLTTDYCVKETVQDALRAGLKVTVLTDAIAGINVKPGDADRALSQMEHGGATLAR